MNKGKSKSSAKTPTNEGNKVGDLFPSASLEEYAIRGKDHNGSVNGHNDHDLGEDDDDEEDDDDDDENDEAEDGDKHEDVDEDTDEDGDTICN